jgi:hypothetical protein
MDISEFLCSEITPEVEEKYDAKKFGIIDILSAMTWQKIDLDFDDEVIKKTYDQYMINRWISMEEELFFIAEMMSTIKNLTDAQHFDLLKSVLPRAKFFNYGVYMKKAKDVTEKDKRYIAHYFEIGISEAEDYIRQMDQSEIDDVLKKYKYGKNDMIKI